MCLASVTVVRIFLAVTCIVCSTIMKLLMKLVMLFNTWTLVLSGCGLLSSLINSRLAIHLGYILVAFSVLAIHDLLCNMLLIQISTDDDGAT